MNKKTERLGLRVSPEDKKEWSKAAAKEGISLSAWLSKWANHGLTDDDSHKSIFDLDN